MQTIYFTTTKLVRHEGNLVDLTEYRRKLAQAEEQAEPEPAEKKRPARRRAARRRRFSPGMLLDCAASAALIVTALSFALRIL